MKKINPTIVFLLFLGLLLGATIRLPAQKNQEKKAFEAFSNFEYSKAIELYRALEMSKPGNADYIGHLARAYYQLRNYQKALDYYSQLIQKADYSDEDLYRFVQLLRISGNDTDAKIWLERYLIRVPGDMTARRQLDNLKLLPELRSERKTIDIVNLPVNTRFPDICPVFFSDRIVYASAKDSFSLVRNNFAWNNQPFLDLFEIEAGPQPDLNTDKRLSGAVNSRVHEGPVTFTGDFSTMYFTRNNFRKGKLGRTPSGVANLKIYLADFSGKEWTNIRGFPYNSNDYSVGHAALSPDQQTLYFISDMPGGYGETDLYKSEWQNGSWGKPVNLGGDVNTGGKEMFPYVDKSGVLYFASDGLPGLGGLDIFAAKEESNGRYTVGNLGAPLNSAFDDFGYVVNTDSLNGYFSSNRPGGKGDDDNYFFAVKAIDLKVSAFDDQTRAPLAEVVITLKNSGGDVIRSAVSDSAGKAGFRLVPGASYVVEVEKKPYVAETKELVFQEIPPDFETGEDFYLKQAASYLTLEVLDKETGLTIANALVDVSQGKYNESELEDDKGVIHMKVYTENEYTFLVTAEEYFDQTVKFSTIGKPPGNYSLAVELDKIESGKQFVLEDLHYELNKWDISSESAVALDKLARILTDNPQVRIEIGSHTDSRGSAVYNLKLSQNRSEAVKNYLVSKGISPDRLVAKGYGESQLINECPDGVDCPEEEQAANRRTVIEILNSDIQKIKRGTKDIYYF